MSAKHKILLVDDDKDFVDTIRTVLESSGYEVVAAYDGGGCLESAKAEAPDVIVLDIMMRTMGEASEPPQHHSRGADARSGLPLPAGPC